MALNIANVFKIITPIDVNFFNKFVKENQKVALTKVLAEQTQTQTGDRAPKSSILLNGAKLISQKGKNVKKVVMDDLHQDKEKSEKEKNPQKNQMLLSKEEQELEEKKQLKVKLPHSSTIYFLEEKNQGQISQDILKKREILDLYETCSKVDVYQERKRKAEINESVDKGTLMNYKHS